MIFLTIFFSTFATLSAFNRPFDPRLQRAPLDWKSPRGRPASLQGETVIENKNVNIIVNVDPKEVAKELWILIQSRLDDRPTRRSTSNDDVTIRALEKIVAPVVAPSRRSPVIPADVAKALSRVTREALIANRGTGSSIENEIDVSQIVARMLEKLKVIVEMKKQQEKLPSPGESQLPRGLDSLISIDDSANSDVVKITLHLKKSLLFPGSVAYSSDSP